jgi:hypothetical protein
MSLVINQHKLHNKKEATGALPKVITSVQLQVAGGTRQICGKFKVEIRERENYKVVRIMVRPVH